MTQHLHSIEETRRSLGGVSRTTVYDLVNSHRLELVKIGRRSFITDRSICRYVDALGSRSTGAAS